MPACRNQHFARTWEGPSALGPLSWFISGSVDGRATAHGRWLGIATVRKEPARRDQHFATRGPTRRNQHFATRGREPSALGSPSWPHLGRRATRAHAQQSAFCAPGGDFLLSWPIDINDNAQT